MSTNERVGANVTKSTYIKSDGLHAFYAGGQTCAGVTGERIFETVTSEVLHWVTHENGNTTLDACYDGTWLRVSEDNGSHWTDCGDRVRFDTESTEEQMMPSGFSLDEKNDILLRFFRGQKADRNCYGYINQGTYRGFYSISRDQGATWRDPVQIVDRGKGYDAVSWGPGFEYGARGGILNGDHCVWMEDGSVVAPFTEYERLDGSKPWFFRVICARGYWKEDMSGLDWVFGSVIEVGLDKATSGCCEPTITVLGGNRLFLTTRCQGGEKEGLYSTRYSAVSEDGGMTWTAPEPMLYDDGTTVWTPASVSAFYESSKTGKTYWIANILDGPVFGQTPRYPLKIAEFDPDNICIVKNSVRLIQDRPDDAHELVRYTNFGSYEDRSTGNLMITLPEQYRRMGWDDMEQPEDFAADCVKYTVEVGG